METALTKAREFVSGRRIVPCRDDGGHCTPPGRRQAGSMGVVAMMTTENQGHLAARTTEYAQDKMEQLLVLSWGDSTSDTRLPRVGYRRHGSRDWRQFESCDTGRRICGLPQQSRHARRRRRGRSSGRLVLKRVWQVTLPAANLKQIAVTVTVKSSLGTRWPSPRSQHSRPFRSRRKPS